MGPRNSASRLPNAVVVGAAARSVTAGTPVSSASMPVNAEPGPPMLMPRVSAATSGLIAAVDVRPAHGSARAIPGPARIGTSDVNPNGASNVVNAPVLRTPVVKIAVMAAPIGLVIVIPASERIPGSSAGIIGASATPPNRRAPPATAVAVTAASPAPIMPSPAAPANAPARTMGLLSNESPSLKRSLTPPSPWSRVELMPESIPELKVPISEIAVVGFVSAAPRSGNMDCSRVPVSIPVVVPIDIPSAPNGDPSIDPSALPAAASVSVPAMTFIVEVSPTSVALTVAANPGTAS